MIAIKDRTQISADLLEYGDSLIAYGVTSDGREVCVVQRIFNVIITLGPIGAMWFDSQW